MPAPVPEFAGDDELFAPGETREAFLEDLREAVMEDIRLVEDERHSTEHRKERVLLVIDIVVLPLAVGFMIFVQLYGLPTFLAPATFIPNCAYMIARASGKLGG